jgi:SAM-dependent methyltransferase/uncharacterized protein YbaR (Trm112 family)
VPSETSAEGRARGSTLAWLIPLLVCPTCRGALRFEPDTDDGLDGILVHDAGGCGERYPVIDEIPRLVTGPERARTVARHARWFEANDARRALARAWAIGSAKGPDATVSAFDFEWRHFAVVGTTEHASIFEEYFDLIAPDRFAEGVIVLDAGCGAGRWAFEVARRGPRVVAVDLGGSVEIARRNTRTTGRVAWVQADLRELPLGSGTVDWAYSLGVLHHLDDPGRALRRIAEVVRGSGPVLLYLYYALDGRGPLYRGLFGVANALRRMTSLLPRPVTLGFAALVAVTIYWPFARAAALVERLGALSLALSLPLAYYRRRSLAVMLNDSLDRFGTRIEARFTRSDVADLFDGAGLPRVTLSAGPPFWHAIGQRAL